MQTRSERATKKEEKMKDKPNQKSTKWKQNKSKTNHHHHHLIIIISSSNSNNNSSSSNVVDVIVVDVVIFIQCPLLRRQMTPFPVATNRVRAGTGMARLVVRWARCPAWCSVVGSILLWGDFFSGRGDYYLGVNMVLTPFPKTSFGWEYKLRSSLCTHAFHRTHSKDPDIHVLVGRMPASKTHPACTICEDGMWQPQWLG